MSNKNNNYKKSPQIDSLSNLYSNPLPSSRSGVLYSAFSYPTKISPESIAVFIASHTKPGDTVLDTFGGSGTTGLATHLCSNPTPELINLAKKLNAPVIWGPRKAVIYELSTMGAFVADVMNNPPDPEQFITYAKNLLSECEKVIGSVYSALDDKGEQGTIRHVIWSDVLECTQCEAQIAFCDALVTYTPLNISSVFKCKECKWTGNIDEVGRVYETYHDSLIDRSIVRKKRILKRIYGTTGKRKWNREATIKDEEIFQSVKSHKLPPCVPVIEIPWGDLYRAGYHKGITHAHHFYTERNLLVMAVLWEQASKAPKQLQNAIKMLLLSYNAVHSTLMTRVVVKSGEKDFVLTGAQSGVLYISGLPVEKNIFEGIRRKLKTISSAFKAVKESKSEVKVICGDSTNLDLPDKSVNYVFTDPPFGDYIPYSELNFLNEVWLGELTKRTNEIIVSNAQKKTVSTYSELMTKVFKEINRILKDDGLATVVFHSAKADIWKGLQNAYKQSGLYVGQSSILDKLQNSFKQTNSVDVVKGDPLLLLSKSPEINPNQSLEIDFVINELMTYAATAGDIKEKTPERLYSRFIGRFLEEGLPVPIDAISFYKIARPLLEAQQ